MYFIIVARDKPDSLSIRMDNRPAHLDYVSSRGCVTLAGPLLTEDAKPQGSLLIIEVADRAAAAEFAAGDPYAQAGLFAGVEITPWTPTLGPWMPAQET
ncbi:MAG: YciI family protein [Alphaproteobacteria bacterium]|nr:YciI family protein [Alphaproteobacteria bacterium]